MLYSTLHHCNNTVTTTVVCSGVDGGGMVFLLLIPELLGHKTLCSTVLG